MKRVFDMVTTIDNLSSQHDWDIVKTFYSYYQNYDPFFYQKIVSQPEKTEDIFGQPSSELEYQCKPAELLMVEVLGDKDMLLAPIKEYGEVREEETKRYFYHEDHLGSANWITESSGIPVQYIHYAPYGELIDNQQATQYDERYKFTGKERDWETGYDFFGARYLWSDAGIWTSVDPLAGDYPWISPYAYAAWNPVKYVDKDGRSFSDFDEDGNYLGTSHDNWWHNTFVGQKGRVLDSNGDVANEFYFADPIHDVAGLKSGELTKLQIVNESDILTMLNKAGAFDDSKNTHNVALLVRYKYILKEGKGLGNLDFAESATGMGSIYGLDTYNSLYMVGNVAYNPRNFGNFLFGAAGVSLGYLPLELLLGAHYNSLVNFSTNGGYKPQLDSKDDQISIILGIIHAYLNQYPSSK